MMPGRLLTACLIVRDEGTRLAACLDSLRGIVDEVVVHDTGSTDDTVALARAYGAIVTEGSWADDFAAARNTALASATTDWVLSIDADERLLADGPALRELLGRTDTDAWLVSIHNRADAGQGYRHRAIRLFRRSAAHWVGALHEEARRCDGREWRSSIAPDDVVLLEHSGYATPADQQAKGVRNARIARRRLDQLLHDDAVPDDAQRPVVARAVLDLGRSLLSAGEHQEALECFEAVRDLGDGTQEWREATDHIVRLFLAEGEDELALGLAMQLSETGGDPQYCAWLAAQALMQLGDSASALSLLESVDELVDPAGRRHDIGPAREARAYAAALTGDIDRAADELLATVLAHGASPGRTDLLRQLWVGAGRPLDALARRLLSVPSENGGPVLVDSRRGRPTQAGHG